MTQVLGDLTGYNTGATVLAEALIPQVWHHLNNPHPGLITHCRYADRQQMLDQTRPMRDALGRMVHGPLRGIFDAATNVDLAWDAPIQSMSLRALRPLGEEAIGVGLTCLSTWGDTARAAIPAGRALIPLRDEAYLAMRLGVDAVKAYDGSLRTSRTDRSMPFAVWHKPSDPLSVGAAGSQEVAIARDMIQLAGTTILYGQTRKVADELGDLLGLPPIVAGWVSGWARQGRGRSVWCVGTRYYRVHHLRHPLEQRFTHTDNDTTNGDTTTPTDPTDPAGAGDLDTGDDDGGGS